AHPTGYAEVWYGRAEGPRINLTTDVVARTHTAKEYTAGQRMYGLVDGDLMYAFDMAAVDQPMQSHLWGQLRRVGYEPVTRIARSRRSRCARFRCGRPFRSTGRGATPAVGRQRRCRSVAPRRFNDLRPGSPQLAERHHVAGLRHSGAAQLDHGHDPGAEGPYRLRIRRL